MTDDKEPGWSKIRIRQPIDDLFQNGPSTEIGICPLPSNGVAPVTVLAQIDTGAHGTGISPRLVERMGLEPLGTGEIREAGREAIVANYHMVRLSLPTTDIELKVVGLPSLREPHDILIGRDLLGNCRLFIDFTTGVSEFHFKAI